MVLLQAPHIFPACSHLKAVTLVVLSPTGKESPPSAIGAEAQPGPLGCSKTVTPPHTPVRYGPGTPGTLRMPSPQQGSWKEWPCPGTSTWAQACQQGALPKGGTGLYLAALGIVRKVALAGKPSGSKRLPGVGVLRALQEEHRQGSGGALREADPLELHKTCKAQPRPSTLLAGAIPKLSGQINGCLSQILPLEDPA